MNLVLLEELASQKKQLDVKVSGVLSYNVQNDETHPNNCGKVFWSLRENVIEIKSRVFAVTTTEVSRVLELVKVDCEVSAWSTWSHCNVLQTCGRGYKTKRRFIKVRTRKLKK